MEKLRLFSPALGVETQSRKRQVWSFTQMQVLLTEVDKLQATFNQHLREYEAGDAWNLPPL